MSDPGGLAVTRDALRGRRRALGRQPCQQHDATDWTDSPSVPRDLRAGVAVMTSASQYRFLPVSVCALPESPPPLETTPSG